MKYYLLTFNEDWADEHNVPALSCMKENEIKDWSKRKLSIAAYLGNGGDDFMEEQQGLTGKELIKLGFVKKHVVTEDFYKIFNKTGLKQLSLSNIFDADNKFEEDVL